MVSWLAGLSRIKLERGRRHGERVNRRHPDSVQRLVGGPTYNYLLQLIKCTSSDKCDFHLKRKLVGHCDRDARLVSIRYGQASW